VNAFLESLAVWLVDFLALSTVLLAGSLLLRLVLRQPASRVALAWGTWLGVAAIALLAALPDWPRYGVSEWARLWPRPASASQPEANLPAVEVLVQRSPPVLIEAEAVTAVDPATGPTKSAEPPWPAGQMPLSHWALSLWLATAALALGWIALGLAQARRLIARATKAPGWAQQELSRIVGSRRRLPGLWSSHSVTSAVALGARRPQIVLPGESVVESNSAAVRAALAHEWAHIRHGDLWLLALERLLLPLLMLHPLFWWLRRSARLDQELLADAAAAGDRPVEYAEALLAWAQAARPPRHAVAALSMWEHPSTLSRRVSMILNSKQPLASRPGRWWLAALALLLAPAIIGLSLLTLRPLTAQDEVARPPVAAPAERDPAALPAPPSGPVTHIQLSLVAMSVSREKLAAAEATLEDLIAEATESHCRREGGLIVADVGSAESGRLEVALKERNAVEILSRPEIQTLDGQEAVIHIGGEVPVLQVEETVNGKRQQRIEVKEFGTRIVIKPQLVKEHPEQVRLEIVAEQKKLLPAAGKGDDGQPRGVPGLVSHKFTLHTNASFGGHLLVADSPADKAQLASAGKEQLLLVVRPSKVMREVAQIYTDPAAGDRARASRRAGSAREGEPGGDEAARLRQSLRAAEAERAAHSAEIAALKRQLEVLKQQLAKHAPTNVGSGATIQFNFKHAPWRDVLEWYAKQSNLSLATDVLPPGTFNYTDEEKHTTAAALDILNAVLLSKGYVLARNGRMLRVFNLDEGAVPESWRHTSDKGTQADSDRVTQVYYLQYAISDALARILTETLAGTKADARVVGEARTNALIVSARQDQLAEVRKLIEALDRPDPRGGPQAAQPAAQAPTPTLDRSLLKAELDEARLEVERAQKDFARVQQLHAAKAVSQEQMDLKLFELERAKIQLRKAEAKLQAPATSAQPAAVLPPAPGSDETQVRLLELELEEAKLGLAEAESELQRVAELREKSPGVISQAELRKLQFQADRAKIQYQKVMVRLESAKERLQPKGPAASERPR
jgi:beta-lactamase regulating signal transducer with metallopeptidase domain/multidrug resistance efflux pump